MNISGLGENTKIKYLRDLIRSEEVEMVCLHETKCSEFGKESCYHLWGYNEIDWVEIGAINYAGGIIPT